ncbi:MAG: hypothetical protein WEC00_06010 [Dongiaceae bacterium]
MADERKSDRDWSEDDSRLFIDEGRYFVPERELQIETICALIPPVESPAHLVELCFRRGVTHPRAARAFPAGNRSCLRSLADDAGQHESDGRRP